MPPIAPFVIKRVFNAPLELVFQVNTQPEHLSKWLSPPGFVVVKADMDFRPGGRYHYGLKGPDGSEMWGRQVYREIVPLEKLVVIQSFSDAEGGVTRHPMSATWPLQTLATTTFKALGPKQTEVTITWMPYEANDEELATFDTAREGMVGGFSGSFTNLDAYLATLVQ